MRLPIIISQILMYVLIGIGLYRFIEEYKTIETIVIEQDTTSIGIVPVLIVSVVVFFLFIGVGMQLLILLWKWFSEHKPAIIFPFLLIIIGVLQLIISFMNSIKLYIATNSLQYIDNLNTYINSSTNLIYWIGGALLVGILGIAVDWYTQIQA